MKVQIQLVMRTMGTGVPLTPEQAKVQVLAACSGLHGPSSARHAF
jgi:hypothetical protein